MGRVLVWGGVLLLKQDVCCLDLGVGSEKQGSRALGECTDNSTPVPVGQSSPCK